MAPARLLAFAAALFAFAAAFATQASAAGLTHDPGAAPYPSAPRAEPLEPGSTAVVRAQGGCLRLRAAPGLTAAVVTCIPDASNVLVLPGAQDSDGFRWQLVRFRALSGWAADEFLHTTPAVDVCPNASGAVLARPGLAGYVPDGPGDALVVWGGGTVAGVETAALLSGCSLTSIWTNRPGGGLVGYIVGAPPQVNAEWETLVGARLTALTPLLLVCGAEARQQVSAALKASSERGAAAPVQLAAAAAPPAIAVAGAVVLDAASGSVLFDLDARRPLPPASLTKIVTAIAAIEGATLGAAVAVDVDARAMRGSSVMGLVPGDCFSLDDLLYGLLLPSGNDAALAIGRHISGSDEAFVGLMNTLAQRIGLTDSYFTDAHGLGSDDHVMSALDIAMAARYAMSLPEFSRIVTTATWTAVGKRSLSMRNGNRFLTTYAGADGVKTGYTEQAGRTLAASAERDGHRLIVVLLDAPDRFLDAARLLDWAFANHAWE